MAATGNWGIVEAVATVVSAGVLVLGVYIARRYGTRADTRIRARLFDRADGGLALEVQVEVKAVGLRNVRLSQVDGQAPRVVVMDVVDDGLRFSYPVQEEKPVEYAAGQWAGPGETVRATELVHLRTPTPDVVGWWIEFSVDARRTIRRWSYVTWTESAFVPIGARGDLDDYSGESDGKPDEAIEATRQASAVESAL